MGARPSIFLPSFAEPLPNFDDDLVYNIGASHVYNMVQESILFPNRYIVYDVRGKADFLKEAIKGAVWGWEGNVLPPDLARLHGVGPASVERAQQNNDSVKVKESKHKSMSVDPHYHNLLKSETKGRTVVAYTDSKHSSHLRSFLRHLTTSKSEYRLLCTLRGGLESLRNARYKVILGISTKESQGPVEIFPPRKTNDFSFPSILISGVDTLPNQNHLISHFRVSVVINLSSISLKMRQGVHLEVFSAKYGAPDLIKVAICLQQHVKRKKIILIADDFQGKQYASAACVAYLVLEGAKIDQAIQFVKEKKPSADTNFLMAIHSLLPNIKTNPTGVARMFNTRERCNILMSKLEQGDEENVMIEETMRNEVMIQDEVKSAAKHAMRFEVKRPNSPSKLLPATENNNSGALAYQGETVLESPRHEKDIKYMKKKSLGKRKLNDILAGRDDVVQDDQIDEKKSSPVPFDEKPTVIADPNAPLDAEYYEYIEIDSDAQIETGVVYHAEDGTAYYYEEVFEEPEYHRNVSLERSDMDFDRFKQMMLQSNDHHNKVDSEAFERAYAPQ